jgi:hypothetical protein
MLKGFQKESGALLHFVKLKEDVAQVLSSSLWLLPVFPTGDHFCQVYRSLSIYWHDLPHNFDPIRLMACLVAILGNFIKLISLNKTLNDLIRTARLLENIERKLGVHASDHISQLVTHGQLALFHPLFDHMDLVLLNHGCAKLSSFLFIQFYGLEEGVEIDEDGCWSTLGLRQILKPGNSFGIP